LISLLLDDKYHAEHIKMNKRKNLGGLFSFLRSKTEPAIISTVCLEVCLSFEAKFQVSYRDASGNLRIKRVSAHAWSTTFDQDDSLVCPIEFKVFIYTPNLNSDQELTMTIKRDGELRVQKNHLISMEKDYAGWFSLSEAEN
jgi:hypothetical protein